jgi:hypothetical protein
MSELYSKEKYNYYNYPNEKNSLADKLLDLRKQAFAYLDDALSKDSNASLITNKTKESGTVIGLYEKSLNIIEEGINYFNKYKSELENNPNAVNTFSQLSRMKHQANERLAYLLRNRQDESTDPQMKNSRYKHLDPNDQMDDFELVTIDNNKYKQNSEQFTDANQLLNLSDGARLFYISENRGVSTPPQPATLGLYAFDKVKPSDNIAAFIKADSWLFPLIPDESPVI